MKLFLIGMPACGKSTLAKEIAEKNNIEYVDTDAVIEEKYQMKISDIFYKFGEKKFRQYEKTVLEELIKKDHYVVATGGGLPCFYDNLEEMNQVGITVYLKMPVEKLLERVLTSSERPLLKGKNELELQNHLEKTLKKRETCYNKAKYIIETKSELEQLKNLKLFDS